ncbi:MAG: aminopeptidase [Phycisphaerales bacterium]|nr:aminopeptidase [Planctomycetota bacterium]MCH8507425.1 aminopeptidase [Phycisphaerales bacterium]
MRDPRLDRLADVLVSYSTRIRRGDLVMIESDPVGLPLVEAVYERVLKAGAHPFWKASSESLTDLFMETAERHQLDHCSPLDRHAVETIDARIVFWATNNTKHLSGIDPKRVADARVARTEITKRFFERCAEGSLRWCGTLFPTQAGAQDAEMSLGQYERFVFEAGLLHLPDPVAAWKQIHDRQERVRAFLQSKSVLRFRAPAGDGHDGTDLTVDVDPSRSVWINCAGTENFPDGEVFCGPQGVDGHVNYTFPAVYNGREVEGVRLVFKGGRVVDASARKNEDFLFAMLDQDEGARNLGEIAIGTNYAIEHFSRNTLFDEKIGGTFHAAVGAGYPESGSSNESALHWDMVCDLRPGPHGGGTIEADGEVFHKDGRFQLQGAPAPV